MSSSSKLLLFAAVLTVGICAASQFRKPPGTTAASPQSPAPLAHRLESPRVVAGPVLSDSAPPHVAEATSDRPAAPKAPLASTSVSDTPPAFPESSPIGSFPLSAPPAWPIAWPTDAQSANAPRRSNSGPRLHRVEDGDTLAALAERYFGDASRAADILHANQDKLPPNGALPIGVDLAIPPATSIPRRVPAQPASQQTSDSPHDTSHGLWHGLPTVPSDAPHDSSHALPSSQSSHTFAEPHDWPADPTAPSQDNPVAPGVIRPASEPLP